MKTSPHLWKFILGFLGLLALVLLIRDFNSRMADLRRLTADKERVGAQATSLNATIAALETQVVHSQSEDAVRDYAYGSGNMQLPEDTPAVPRPVDGEISEPTPVVLTPEEPVQNWQLWLALFINPEPEK